MSELRHNTLTSRPIAHHHLRPPRRSPDTTFKHNPLSTAHASPISLATHTNLKRNNAIIAYSMPMLRELPLPDSVILSVEASLILAIGLRFGVARIMIEVGGVVNVLDTWHVRRR